VKRGEVWWADLPAPLGRRPVVLLSRDEVYRVRNAATVAAVTTSVRQIPVEVPLTAEDGLPKFCVVNVDNLMTIGKERLKERICSLGTEKMEALGHALRFALDL